MGLIDQTVKVLFLVLIWYACAILVMRWLAYTSKLALSPYKFLAGLVGWPVLAALMCVLELVCFIVNTLRESLDFINRDL